MSHVQTPTLHIQLQHYTLKTCLGPVLLLHLYITTHILHCIISPQLHIAICVCQRNHQEGINRLTFFFFKLWRHFQQNTQTPLEVQKAQNALKQGFYSAKHTIFPMGEISSSQHDLLQEAHCRGAAFCLIDTARWTDFACVS